MSEKQFNFIYKVINTITNQYYIGMHSTNKMNDGYLGSGIRIKRSVEKYGKENHRIEVLESFGTRKDLIAREKELITQSMLHDPLCLNLTEGGEGGYGWDHVNSDEIIRQKIANTRRGRKNKPKEIDDELRAKLSSGRKGKTFTEEQKMKIAKSQKCRPIIVDGVEYFAMSAAVIGVGLCAGTIKSRALSTDPKYSNYYFKDSPKS